MSKAAAQEDQRAMTSMRVFREFIKRTHNRDGSDSIDASGVVSRECYDLWVETRKQLPPNPEKAFQRSLSAHVTGVDGRVPFTPSEEAAVLKILRRKERWPCFEQSSTRFGLMGFRAKGYHEKTGEGGESSKKRVKRDDDGDDDDESERSDAESESTTHVEPMFVAKTQGSVLASMTPSFMGLKPDEFTFTPQVPVTINITDPSGGFNFLDTAQALLNRFYVAGLDAWSTVLSIARMLLVSKGWATPPTLEDTQRLLREYEAKYPGSNVLALDPTTRTLKDRILSMSPGAVQYLGPVSRDKEGLDRRLIPLTDAWAALTTAFAAYKAPGIEVATRLNILCRDGLLRPATCYFSMHPQERLLMLRAE